MKVKIEKKPLLIFFALLWFIVSTSFICLKYNNYKLSLTYLMQSRIGFLIEELQQKIENGIDKSTILGNYFKLQNLIDATKLRDTSIFSIDIYDIFKEKIIFSTNRENIGKPFNRSWLTRNSQNNDIGDGWLSLKITNVINEEVGGVVISYYNNEGSEILKKARMIFFLCFSLFLFSGWLLLLGLWYIVFAPQAFFANSVAIGYRQKVDNKSFLKATKSPFRNWRFYMVFFLFLVMPLPLFFYGIKVDNYLKPRLGNLIVKKSQIICLYLRDKITEGLSAGIPFRELPKVENYLQSIAMNNSEVVYALITDDLGRVVYENGNAKDAFSFSQEAGNIVLKKGYYNTAEALNVKTEDGNQVLGWVQIGAVENFPIGF